MEIKSKDKIMMEVQEQMDQSEKSLSKYNEGYVDGYSDGYDKGVETVRAVAIKYSLGGEKAHTETELKPAIRFLNQSLGKLIEKVVEEVDEVVQAYNDGESVERIAEELADVQLAAETAMSKLPSYVQEKRRSTRIGCIKKNSDRGYYMPPRDKYGD
jgi:flagellar biosynthesis/type III secretory pathway protein FliH